MYVNSRATAIAGVRIVTVILALIATACASPDEDLSETLAGAADDAGLTTLPSVPEDSTDGPSTTPSTDPSGSPSTTAPKPPAAPATDDALVLAQVLEVGAAMLESMQVANQSADPFGPMIDLSVETAEQYRAIRSTEATATVVADFAASADAQADLFRRYQGLLSDPSTAAGSLPEFLAENEALALEAGEIDGRLLTLVDAELARQGGPVADYFTATGALQRDSAAMLNEIFGALQLLATDPFAGLRAMREPVEAIGRLGEQMAQVDPPPAVEDYHQRYVEYVDAYAAGFGDVLDAIEAGRTPDFGQLQELQQSAAQAVELNAERSRLLASALRRELD